MNTDYVIYVQEDWLLIDHIEPNKIKYIIDFMISQNCGFLMSYLRSVSNSPPINTIFENYIFQRIQGHYMQPSIWKKNTLDKMLLLNIPILENESGAALDLVSKENCYSLYNTRFRDIASRTLYFPHMHALYRGKWTFLKFPSLKALVESYGIDTSTRDVDTEWIVDFQ